MAKSPQPHNFHITNRKVIRPVRVCYAGTCSTQLRRVWEPAQPSNPLAPYFPPFTHFVLLLRENHTFDDYLGDCATTIQAGCQGQVESTNHITQVPNLHALADTLKVQVLNSSGTVLSTLHTYSNLDHNTGYIQRGFSLSGYAGQKITLKFTGAEDYEMQTSFVIDDTAINVG